MLSHSPENPRKHDWVRGADAKASESYTDSFVREVHEAWIAAVSDYTLQSAPGMAARLGSEPSVPRMPRKACPARHRPRVNVWSSWPLFNACVARPVGKKEVLSTLKAQEAMEKEWNNLTKKGCWNLDGVRAKG